MVFAYTKSIVNGNEIIGNLRHYEKPKKRIRNIRFIELKIINNRFFIRYDGLNLELLENERPIYTISKNKNIDNFIKINTAMDINNELKDGVYQISKTSIENQFLINQKNNIFKNLKDLPENFDIEIFKDKKYKIIITRYYEDLYKTASKFQTYKLNNQGQYENQNINGYFLEPSGYDNITSNIQLRIPEGLYYVSWRTSFVSFVPQNNTLKLENDYISKARAILIHDGNSPKQSDGCLLIKANEAKDKYGNIIDNILGKKYKKIVFEQHIKKYIKKYFVAKENNKNKNGILNHIEVRIRNKFIK